MIESVPPTRHRAKPTSDTNGALPDAAGISRALAGLRRKPQQRPQEIDELATAQRSAELGVLSPVLRRTTSNWLDLSLVVDDGPSMDIWAPTVAAFRNLATRLGLFRDVRTFALDPAGAPFSGSAWRDRSVPALSAPHPSRLVLVFTDAVGHPWADGTAMRVLRRWGKYQTVAVINVMPQRMWGHVASAVNLAEFDAPPRSVTNAQWRVRLFNHDPPTSGDIVPVPMFALDRYWLAALVRLVNGGSRDVRATLLLNAPPPTAREQPLLGPEEQVHRFRGTASMAAYRLACHLAAIPLSLPLMRAVQHAVLPASPPADLAEVYLSGLLREVGPEGDFYDFEPGVRQELLAGLTRSDALTALSVASDWIGDRQDPSVDFGALLSNSTETSFATPQGRWLAATTAEVLAAFGPRYQSAAERLYAGHGVNLAPAAPADEHDRERRDRLRSRAHQHRCRQLRELTVSGTPALEEQQALAEILRTEDVSRLDLPTDLTGAYLVDADFHGCRFTRLTATGATFAGTTTFDGAQFAGETVLDGTVFKGMASFVRCRFEGPVRFRNAAVGAANFVDSRFASSPDLSGTRFEGPVQFSDGQFAGG